MDSALYKDGQEEKIINAYDITRREYQETYKGKLFCTTEECNAILEYNDKQKGGISKYFSTKPNSQHKEGCINEVIHHGTRPSSRTGGTIGINVNENQRKRILDEAYKIVLEELNPSQTDSKPIKKKKKKPTTTIDEDISRTSTTGGVPIIDGSGEDRDGVRAPYVYKRDVSELRDDDLGTTKEVHGLVGEIRINENEAYIDLIGRKGEKVSLYIGNTFKVNFAEAFRNLHWFGKYLEKASAKNHKVICNSIGQVGKADGKMAVQIYDYKDIRFDGLGLYQVRYIISQ